MDRSCTGARSAFEADGGPAAKRRKVRKGTRSCWECRRRKMKCIFGSAMDETCTSCERRGAKCVGQEFPEEISASLDRNLKMNDRVERVEAIVERLLEKVPGSSPHVSAFTTEKDDVQPTHGIPTPTSVTSDPSQFLAMYKPSADDDTVGYEILDQETGPPQSIVAKRQFSGPGKYKRLSRALHDSLPSPQDTETIARACSGISTLFSEMLTVPYPELGKSVPQTSETLLERPRPDVHPVLIARHMLYLATFSQHLHPGFHKELQGTSEPPRRISKRLADTAISLVTANDDLVGSIEALECIILECMYHTNGGNLRKSLIAIRRAITIAQLMGLHRPGARMRYEVLGPETKVYPQFIWFRVLSTERHLCLMLGLPQGNLDHSMASEAALATDTPMGRLDRIHCVITSRLVERNQSDLDSQDFARTRELDGELQRAAAGLPSKWWLAAKLFAAADEPQAMFWDMRRLYHHLYHYYLLIQLHLPYMLRSPPVGHSYDYSQIMCVNAAREVLARFIMYRGFNRGTFCCRTIDFFALMASMTLLLAHLDGHRRSAAALARESGQQQQHGPQAAAAPVMTENMLMHQRPSDCAMVEQVQESMDEVSRMNADPLSAHSADLLRQLLAIEAQAANGGLVRSNPGGVGAGVGADTPASAEEVGRDGSGAVRLRIPYFGTVKIAGGGAISKEAPKPPPSIPAAAAAASSSDKPGGRLDADRMVASDAGYDCNDGTPTETEARTLVHADPSAAAVDDASIGAEGLLQSAGAMAATLSQSYEDQITTAWSDDWEFEGVDTAFFDSLMRGAGDYGSDGAEWLIWPQT